MVLWGRDERGGGREKEERERKREIEEKRRGRGRGGEDSVGGWGSGMKGRPGPSLWEGPPLPFTVAISFSSTLGKAQGSMPQDQTSSFLLRELSRRLRGQSRKGKRGLGGGGARGWEEGREDCTPPLWQDSPRRICPVLLGPLLRKSLVPTRWGVALRRGAPLGRRCDSRELLPLAKDV